MKLEDGQLDQLAARPSMESFQFLDPAPSSRARTARPPQRDHRRRMNLELQAKAEELEKLYAAYKVRVSGERTNSRARRLGEVEFDGDLLLKLVDDLEFNMKLSRSEISKGRLYEKYVEKREAKLREDLGSKGAQKRMEMKVIENKFEESLAQLRVRCRDKESVKSYQNEEKDLHEQIQCGKKKSSNDTVTGDGSLRMTSSIVLFNTDVTSTSLQTSAAPIPKPPYRHINPDSTRGRAHVRNPSAQSLPNFAYLRKENKKPPARVGKANNSPSQSHTCAGSKSTINFGELKDLTSMNSFHNSNIASSKFSKQQSQKTIPSKILGNESRAVHRRRASCLDAGAQSKLSASKAREIVRKEDESEIMLNQQIYSPDLIKREEKEFERRVTKERASIFHIGSDSEEPRSSQEPGNCDIKPEKYDSLKDVEELDNVLAASSKSIASSEIVNESLHSSSIHHSQSCMDVASTLVNDFVHAPIGSTATWNCSRPNKMQEADASRGRKKWGRVEKPNLATNTSDQLLKDVAKQVKKLLRFGRKGKSADGTVKVLACASSAFGGDDDADDEPVKLSSADLKKSSNGNAVPAYAGLHEGKIFPEQVQSPSCSFSASHANIKVREDHHLRGFPKATCSVFSFLSFHGRGGESYLN